MKKISFRIVESKEAANIEGMAIAFIKSRKADHKIHTMAA